jgi:ribonucleoside-diphosphate reductase alpha subunit
MYVVKRSGKQEAVSFDKIARRLNQLSSSVFEPYGALCAEFSHYVIDDDLLVNGGPLKAIDPIRVTQKVCAAVHDGITTTELDTLAAEHSAHMQTLHPEYAVLASRIEVSNVHKVTPDTFQQAVKKLEFRLNPVFSNLLLTDDDRARTLEDAIDYRKDYAYDYFGIKTMQKLYLLKDEEGKLVERPQHLLMWVAVWVHLDLVEKTVNVPAVIETYRLMSERFYTHATPTLFNAGTKIPQMSSCFLVGTLGTREQDSIVGMYDAVKEIAYISKLAGGIGMHVHEVRARGAHIHGTNGKSSGLVPYLRVLNNVSRHVDQAGVRKGAIAIYLEPWHADVEAFLELRKNTGVEEEKARDLFTALWVPDLFFQRVVDDEDWSLFCPSEAPGLSVLYRDDFKELYERYETYGIARKVVKARSLWEKALRSLIETGTPYISAKDAVNKKSNQKNLGTIKSSNLYNEITLFSDPKETAVCTLASVALSKFVKYGQLGIYFDFAELHAVVKMVARNLDRVIDQSMYPDVPNGEPKCERSNKAHRPLGIGVQGFADTLYALRLPFDSDGAREINIKIFETMYHAAVESSCEMAQELGRYSSFEGSPASEGLLQFDLWDVKPSKVPSVHPACKDARIFDWDTLKEEVKKHGLRNSTLIALMPTASTSQLLQNSESFEVPTGMLYSRKTLAGEHVVSQLQFRFLSTIAHG